MLKSVKNKQKEWHPATKPSFECKFECKIESVHYFHAPLVFKFLGFLVYEKNKYIKISLASIKTLSNSKYYSESRIHNSVPSSLSVIG